MIKKIINKIKSLRATEKLNRIFLAEYKTFKNLHSNRFIATENDLYPCFYDKTTNTGFDAHYIYHPAWATRIIKKINPARHIDISSTLHFCSTISAFFKTEFYDYRPAILSLSDLKSKTGDLNNLPLQSGSVECISCMHTVEHIGLGRYGDQLDPDGDLKAIKELQRVTKVGGHLLIVTPVGKPRIRFNAHRIYSYGMIHSLFTDFELLDFSLVKDDQTFIENADAMLVAEQNYGCGCFWFKKIR